MVNPLWEKDTARSTASKLVYNYMGKNGDGILNIQEESTLFTNVVIPIDWNQTEMKKVGNYQLKVTAQAIQRRTACWMRRSKEALCRRSGALA